jgi:hypothetical protein
MCLSRLNGLAYALPYRRFARTLAGTGARLRADADRYSFTVVDPHHLLLAGFTGALKVTLFPDVPSYCTTRRKCARKGLMHCSKSSRRIFDRE